ncbi:cell surface glycoprotein 1 isoform X2 [Phlebotomus papatasi]|uniref:cell surface glycoprotein 1 isoform X2 n=1 Tax=Phlebotomus papatasi TaxID=29031 RepID=UPI0024842448|nr:cell surface glycoprotein 1 isoform X2 [Phlebotomus papatasi]
MIGSFWNLCRACPSMPIDKLHSEYRSTYRWHEYTGGSRPEVVRRPPMPNQFAPINEPPLPRRKKCPELAYKTNEFMSCDAPDGRNTNVARARPGERCQIPSRRSKSEGPPENVANGRASSTMREIVDGNQLSVKKTGESSGLFKKTISKLSTEYRLQFVWPNVHRVIRGQTDDTVEPPRKSISMGAIKQPAQSIPITTVHKKRTTEKKEAAAFELEPLVTKLDESLHNNIDKTMYRKKNYMAEVADNQRHSEKEKYGFSADKAEYTTKTDNKVMANGYGIHGDSWFKEVLELRKKAGEYKCRGWGIEIDPELYKKQEKLWEQVSRRSSLSALSLASTVRPFTKEEKDKENTKKSSPTKAPTHKVSGQVYPTFDNALLRRDAVRHHLERTTGPDVEEGTLLPSPTRDKLMPTIPKSREDEHYTQRGSPKKSIASRHESPQKSSPQKGSPKKTPKSGHKGRSQSVGPTVTDSGSSPKRQSRSSSTAPASASAKTTKKPQTAQGPEERRPRPTTLSTTPKSFRSKSSSLHPSGRALSAPNHLPNPSLDGDGKNLTSSPIPHLRKSVKTANNHQLRPKSSVINGDPMADSMIRFNRRNTKKSAETEDDAVDEGRGVSPPVQESAEYIVKSPPEPTRVKSPEQILMRSPDPVNWTVPLDTGKTFTVTQNVRDGEAVMRPHSDFKASTPVDKPPPAPLSAPPELAEQMRLEAAKDIPIAQTILQGQKMPDPMTMSTVSATPGSVTEVRYDKPVPGSTLRRLEDPAFEPDPKRQGVPSTEPFEKAHDRFDRFWGGEKA